MNSNSLFEISGRSVFVEANEWVMALFAGQFFTAIALIAVAILGMTLLSGYLNVRSATQTVGGLFLLFGAADMAYGLLNVLSSNLADAPGVLPPAAIVEPKHEGRPPAVDPYAGPSLPMQ